MLAVAWLYVRGRLGIYGGLMPLCMQPPLSPYPAAGIFRLSIWRSGPGCMLYLSVFFRRWSGGC